MDALFGMPALDVPVLALNRGQLPPPPGSAAFALSPEEEERWEAHRKARLMDGAGGARTAEQLQTQTEELFDTADERAQEILGALSDYVTEIAPEC